MDLGCLDMLEEIPSGVSFFFTKPPLQVGQLEQSDYLYPQAQMDSSALLNELWSVFFRFQQWETQLQICMRGRDSIQKLGDCSIEFLRNPTGLYAASFYVICYWEKSRPAEEAMFNPHDKNAYIEQDSIDTLLSMNDFIQTWSTKGPALFFGDSEDEGISDCCLYQNLEINGKIPARVSISNYDNPFRESDYAVLDFFCGYITQALIESKTFSANIHPPFFDQILLDMVAGRPYNKKQLLQVLHQMGWKWDDSFLCGYIYSRQDDAIGSIANACSRLEDYVPGSCAVQQDNHILLVVNLCRAGKTREEILSKIVYHLWEYLLKAGFSNAFTGIENLYEYDRQARIALNFGMKKDSTFWVYRFENYVLQFLLEHATQDLTPESLCHPGLLWLIECDRKKNRDYAGTLRVYLENNMNVAQTIRQIYIQRATFQYQLQRITEIVGANLQNYETRLHLLLSFRLLDLKKQTAESE